MDGIKRNIARLEQEIARINAGRDARADEVERMEQEDAAAVERVGSLISAKKALESALTQLTSLGVVEGELIQRGTVRAVIFAILGAAQDGLSVGEIIARLPAVKPGAIRSQLFTAKRQGALVMEGKRYRLVKPGAGATDQEIPLLGEAEGESVKG